ncbi:cell division protein FtsX [Sphingomonas aquatilis]|uniref:cell division protein FtsX n=1 Tax=Sphingomonas aquatilis TaxID=93063 RepID=UPI001FBAF5D6|nr:FtsX-like permease family protein [Sphingomonas aquatilis]GKS03200.1 cell division protein [Sphingomonas aquatilis]
MSTGGTNRADRRVLDEAGGFRAMTGVMAIMLFLTLLAAALGLGTRQSATALERQLAGRLTVQVVDGSPVARDAVAARILAVLRALPDVRRATPVPRAELMRLLEPWLGRSDAGPDLPIPAMIDVDLADGADAGRIVAAVHDISATARIDRHQRWMSPVGSFLDTLTWLALGLVALMLAATGAVVVLAARAGLETHRATIEVMHMLGATDVQVARLFQRRLALDAAIGGVAGSVAALAMLLFLATRVAALGSQLLSGITLSFSDWALLVLLPIGFVLLATVIARVTIVAALRRIL